MPYEPILLAQATVEAGGYCIPWTVAVAIASPLAGAVVYQTRRIVQLTNMLDQARRDHIESFGDRHAG